MDIMEFIRKEVSGLCDRVCTAAIKADIDPDAALRITAGFLTTVTEVATFKNYVASGEEESE